MMIFLDGRFLTDKAAAHDHLAKRLELPAWYGRNLDALYDLLTGHLRPCHIVVIHKNELLAQLGGYGESLLETLRDAAEAVAGMELTVY
ncbi:MAG: barstar family protein [Oscillospiraceae bacterium]|nr:barstar family protein [Oscillospiraceae bacterium]